MRKLTILTILFFTSAVYSQSVLTIGAGASLGVLTGTDLCANTINGGELIYGGGTICGGLVAVEPVSSAELPVNFGVPQNYPNPFNPVTTVKYRLPKVSYVSVKLYDQPGKEIGVLFEGSQSAGYYSLTFDGSEFASGIYFCRITAGQTGSGYLDFSKTIKMLLVK